MLRAIKIITYSIQITKVLRRFNGTDHLFNTFDSYHKVWCCGRPIQRLQRRFGAAVIKRGYAQPEVVLEDKACKDTAVNQNKFVRVV